MSSAIIPAILSDQPPLPPGIRARLACSLYETMLLVGVLALGFTVPHLVIGLVWKVTAPSWVVVPHLFILLGGYFVWYWVQTGQTLAMQTWRIHLVTNTLSRVSLGRAMFRYSVACLWLVPAVLVDYAIGVTGAGHLLTLFLFGLFFWPLTALLSPDRQCLHDRLSGTQMIRLSRWPGA